MRRPWILSVLLPVAFISLGTASCDGLLRSLSDTSDEPTLERVDNSSASDQPVGTQALTTTEGRRVLENDALGIEIVLPASWSDETGLNPVAELQASDRERQLYIIVVAEEADSMMRLGLEENAANYRELLAQRMTVSGQSKTDVAFVGNNFATQYEMRGRLEDNTPVVYLHTTVVSEDRYYQVVGWTTPEQYETYRSELQAITDTFRETRL